MRALCLFSGGLDSMLSVKLITNQNIKVTALFMDIGFGSAIVDEEKLAKRANFLGADFKLVNIRQRYLDEVLFNPKYGYGKHFNPCIDCHGFMFNTALSLLKEYDASFVISGEVLGQRPMSQRKNALNSVRKIANDSDLILRPMSAKLMSPTKPEILGWVDREKLLDISGRGRSRQLELAKEFGFSEFDSPSGGCLLTLEHFSNKIKDHVKFAKFDEEDIDLLKFGRHLRLPNNTKLIIGRNEEDNINLDKIKNSKFHKIRSSSLIGPISFIEKTNDLEDFTLAARLILTYSKTNKEEIYKLKIGDLTLDEKPFESKEKALEFLVK